jgi:thiamine-monophosphate kinase
LPRTISNIGEEGVIRLFKTLFPRGRHILENYDDAWCFLLNGQYVTISTDMLVSETDIPPGMTMAQAARKAVVMGISDIVSKGHRPSFYLMSLGLRPDMTELALHQALGGIHKAIKEYGGQLVGGDTNEADQFIANITTVGVGRNAPVPRRLGKVGDIIATTGRFGGPPAGLSVLLGRAKRPARGWHKILDSVVMPRAQVLAGPTLAEAGVLSGSTDSSDGLSSSLYNMGVNSDHGAFIEKIPLLEGVQEFASLNDLDSLDLALNGGEEYHLVLSIKKDRWEMASNIADRSGFDLIRIGRVTSPRGIWMKDGKGRLFRIRPGGWQHFHTSPYALARA